MDFKIKDVIDRIYARTMFLPAIQRKFVWSTEQIESFFDSILKGYPIGMFLFWNLSKEVGNNYTFYEFIREYNENNDNFNQSASNKNIPNNFIAVLDGQQRLTSLYIGLMGMYTSIRRNGQRAKMKLYLNLLKQPQNMYEDDYEFKFLTQQNEAQGMNENKFWFPVAKILSWNKPGDYFNDGAFMDRINAFLENYNQVDRKEIERKINSMLTNLWNKIHTEKLIEAHIIDTNSMDETLEIFSRVNSGGTKLSKSDLLFSIIVANWNDGREKVEDLLNDINNKGSGFDFDTDFVIKASLFLNDLPIELSANALTNNNNNIDTIRSNWERTKNAIEKAVDLLVKFNFTDRTLTSKNAVIPIAYYYFRTNARNFNDKQDKKNIENYLIRALIKHIYGGHSDSVLERVRSTIRGIINNNPNNVFPLQALLNANLGTDKSLNIDPEDVDEILKYRYDEQSNYTFMVLSLLYKNALDPTTVFHQDHIHPKSFFTEARLRRALANRFNQDLLREWKEKCNMLPNLQLLEGSENQEKSNTPFEEWLYKSYRNDDRREEFLKNNFIPTDVNLSISNFDQFFEARKQLLRNKLCQIFGVNAQNNVAQNQINAQNAVDYRGKQIVAFTLNRNRYKVNTWRDLLIKVCRIVLSDPNNNKKDITQVRLNGRNRRNPRQRFYIKTKNSRSTDLEPITDKIYVDTSGLNSNSFVNLSKEVLRYFRYNPEKDFQIETKDS